MAEHREPNLNIDGAKSYFQKTVVLRNWWLIKCSNEFEGKRFGVAGTEDSVETRAMRVFTSSPIIKALDVFTLLASDGIYITLRGFLNKERLVKNGFIPQISREFIFGFPPCWERICNSCFGGDSFGTNVNTVPSKIDKACSPILKPCKNMEKNQEDNPAESRDKSTVAETNTGEIGIKDGSRARDKKTARRKSLHLQLKSGGKGEEDERKLESSNVQKTTNDGDHCGADLNKAKSSDVEKDECEAMSNEDNEWKLDESKAQNSTSDRNHGSEGLDKAKSSDVEKDKCDAIDSDVISPADGCGRKHTGADNVNKVTSTSTTTGESITSEQRKGELNVTTASPHSLHTDLGKSSKPGMKGKSKKNGNTLRRDSNVVEPMNYSGTKVKSAKNKRKLDVSKVQNPTTNAKDYGNEGLNKAKSNDVEVISPVDGCGKRHFGTDGVEKLTSKNATKESLTSEQRKGRVKVTKKSRHSLSKDLNNSSTPEEEGKSKKRGKALKSNSNVAEENMSWETEENLSWGKTKRKIDFDVEVTPDKETKKQNTNVLPTDSLGQKRSRSGRVLVSSLEFWRNQIPVYDMDRNLTQVKEGRETKGKGSDSRTPKKKKIK